MAVDFLTLADDGGLDVSFHPGQERAWDAEARFVAVLAGTQGGKTCFGPLWLFREMQRKGPGDYMVVSPTFPLLQKKALPEFKRLFEDLLQIGTYKAGNKVFEVSPSGEQALWGETQDTKTVVYFGYAENPESLESATAKGAWLDEAGQKAFRLDSWHAILRRLALNMGRALITTTWYNLGWMKTRIWDAWKAGDPDVEVVRFESIANPMFPEAEWERAKRDLPAWKFDLFYRAIPTRPAGVIYDSFDPDEHVVPAFTIPGHWPRYVGIDFGGVNTAAVFYARDPDQPRMFYLYDEYKAGGRTAEQHARRILEKSGPMPRLIRGGAKSEGQWRLEFQKAGLPVKGPVVKEVEVGIDRVYGFHQRAEIGVFESCEGYLEEKATYSRKMDEGGEPTEKIEDKHAYHFMDAERYIMPSFAPQAETPTVIAPVVRAASKWIS